MLIPEIPKTHTRVSQTHVPLDIMLISTFPPYFPSPRRSSLYANAVSPQILLTKLHVRSQLSPQL